MSNPICHLCTNEAKVYCCKSLHCPEHYREHKCVPQPVRHVVNAMIVNSESLSVLENRLVAYIEGITR
jgi:hypothetical protein